MRGILYSKTIVVKFCLPGSLPHILDLVDEYLSPFISFKIFTATSERGEQYKLWNAYFGGTTSGFIAKAWKHEYCLVTALELAAEHRHIEVVQWTYYIHSPCCDTYSDEINRAVANGYLAIIQGLYSVSGTACSAESSDEARICNKLARISRHGWKRGSYSICFIGSLIVDLILE
ncbi:hypothetical protein PHMEG_00011945 [Phytophthora megakarya]|uniref:Uncharacterized protein n=1 Tax=Phytophthora megakarya TaxID=4795 RepID=A0A225WAI0_9STRA|nr:hypothetical protein PHMEG_00011945 [Phytophthora megakarya]